MPDYNSERNRLIRQLREMGYKGGSKISRPKLREAVQHPERFPELSPIPRYPKIIPYDFSGVTPKPGAIVKWKSPEPYRRAGVRGIGRFQGIAPDGRFQIKYTIPFPSGYATKTVRVHPRFIVDYQEA